MQNKNGVMMMCFLADISDEIQKSTKKKKSLSIFTPYFHFFFVKY